MMKENAMYVHETKRGRHGQGAASAQVETAVARLSNEDSKLGEHLLNAAVAGAVIARQPADTILRAEAAEAWNSIKPVIDHHLGTVTVLADEDMDMIRHASNFQDRPFFAPDNSAQIIMNPGKYLTRQPWFALLGAEYKVKL